MGCSYGHAGSEDISAWLDYYYIADINERYRIGTNGAAMNTTYIWK
ncbi:MAG: hypothetical protein LKI76_05015 [Megasphaera sp.]|nr:hypothetical protein [Megasphaera sp.]